TARLRAKLRERRRTKRSLRYADRSVSRHSWVVLGEQERQGDHGDADVGRLLQHGSRVPQRGTGQEQDVPMKYLALIYLNEDELAATPARDLSDLNARHLDFNDSLRASGHFIVAEALAPSQETAHISKRDGKVHVTDGPFTEAKEVVAGFYLIEANDMAGAI